jgi:hypothetical protein
LCGVSKPKDIAHRSISVNTDNGVWLCHRCSSTGVLREYWSKKADPIGNFRQRQRASIKEKFSLNHRVESRTDPSAGSKLERLRDRYEEFKAMFIGSPAEEYLVGRGISKSVAIESGCGYAAAWQHWENSSCGLKLIGTDRRVIFPVYDQQGELVAISARAIDSNYIGPKAITRGRKSLGVFTTKGGLEAGRVLITEAPIDALSLAMAGYPAIAMIGTSWADWLPRHCAFRNVAIATDADEAGDEAAIKLTQELKKWGSRYQRLKPEKAKDWNEALMLLGEQGLKQEVNKMLDCKLSDSELMDQGNELATISEVVQEQSSSCPECGRLMKQAQKGEWIYLDCEQEHYSLISHRSFKQ